MKFDHTPLLLKVEMSSNIKRGSFHFQKMWLQHQVFAIVVELNCNEPITAFGIHKLWGKLKRLKQCLKDWNKDVFGNVISAVEETEDKVRALEIQFESTGNDNDKVALSEAKTTYLRNLSKEETYWSQSSGIKWAIEGDKCTSFFHSYVKKKRKKSAILGINDEGNWLETQENIRNSGTNFF